MFVGGPSVHCPSVNIYIDIFLIEGFQRNLLQICSRRVGIAEKVFKVTGQRSKVKVMDQTKYNNSGGMYFDGVASTITCLNIK